MSDMGLFNPSFGISIVLLTRPPPGLAHRLSHVRVRSIFNPVTGSIAKSAKGIEPQGGAAYGSQMANSTVAELAVAIALQEAAAGVFERANDNRGDRIDDYQQSTSGKLGEAWCMKFVYWCFEQAARRLNAKNPMPALFGAPNFENWAKASKKLVTTPALGDVFVKESRHGGLVTGPAIPGGTFPSVEGNTWAKSDFAHRREGVYVLENEKTLKCTFARLI